MVLVGKAVIAQGGGPTAVINQSLVGVITEAKKYAQVTGIYGAINGVEGIVKEEFIDLSQETTVNLEKIAKTPSSALLSTRVKPDVEFCKKIFEVFKAHDVRFFFYIGGNDSSDTVRILNDQAKVEGYDFRAVHIPKTIDNDLMCNDHTPGYASAAKFVMQAFSGINLDMRALAGVYIGVVMGRNAGFLTAAAGMASKRPEDGPHLVYLPETPFCMDKFITDVKEVYDRLGRCVIAVSEGIVDETGLPIVTKYMENIERDDHGNIRVPILGELNVLGYTTDEVRLKVEKQLLEEYFKKDANIFVTVKLAGLKYTINGEIGSPGIKFLYQDRATIMEAIANSGDIPITGNRKDVQIIRKFPHGFETYSIDLTKESAMNSPYFYIQPNDYIIIKPLKQKTWGTGVTGVQSVATIMTAISLITTLLVLSKTL